MVRSASQPPVSAVRQLKCGCYYGKAARERIDHWHLCDTAQVLLWHWRDTGTVEDHDKYQNHFRNESSSDSK